MINDFKCKNEHIIEAIWGIKVVIGSEDPLQFYFKVHILFMFTQVECVC